MGKDASLFVFRVGAYHHDGAGRVAEIAGAKQTVKGGPVTNAEFEEVKQFARFIAQKHAMTLPAGESDRKRGHRKIKALTAAHRREKAACSVSDDIIFGDATYLKRFGSYTAHQEKWR